MENDSASFKRKQENLKNLFHPVSSMGELRKKRENSHLPDDQQVEEKEPEGEIKMTDSSGRSPHRHTAIVDADGNGKTRRTFDDEPHTHDIAGGKVIESGLVPHIHELEEA